MAFLLGPNGLPFQTKETDHMIDNDESGGVAARLTNGMYDVPWPTRHMPPIGVLAPTPACAATWRFLHLAHHIIEETPKQVTLEGDDDVEVNLVNVARSLAIAYGTSVEEMFDAEAIRRNIAEAKRCGRAIETNLLAFMRSGGKVYANYERNPNADSL